MTDLTQDKSLTRVLNTSIGFALKSVIFFVTIYGSSVILIDYNAIKRILSVIPSKDFFSLVTKTEPPCAYGNLINKDSFLLIASVQEKTVCTVGIENNTGTIYTNASDYIDGEKIQDIDSRQQYPLKGALSDSRRSLIAFSGPFVSNSTNGKSIGFQGESRFQPPRLSANITSQDYYLETMSINKPLKPIQLDGLAISTGYYLAKERYLLIFTATVIGTGLLTIVFMICLSISTIKEYFVIFLKSLIIVPVESDNNTR